MGPFPGTWLPTAFRPPRFPKPSAKRNVTNDHVRTRAATAWKQMMLPATSNILFPRNFSAAFPPIHLMPPWYAHYCMRDREEAWPTWAPTGRTCIVRGQACWLWV